MLLSLTTMTVLNGNSVEMLINPNKCYVYRTTVCVACLKLVRQGYKTTCCLYKSTSMKNMFCSLTKLNKYKPWLQGVCQISTLAKCLQRSLDSTAMFYLHFKTPFLTPTCIRFQCPSTDRKYVACCLLQFTVDNIYFTFVYSFF